MHLGDEMRRDATAASSIAEPVLQSLGAWRFGLSHDPKLGLWMFSAQLVPVGRSSTLREWEDLGKMQALVRVPPDLREFGLTVEHFPNVVHKWAWIEKDGKTIGLASLDEALAYDHALRAERERS